MRLGIISDVHGNAASLERALDLMADVDDHEWKSLPDFTRIAAPGTPILRPDGTRLGAVAR